MRFLELVLVVACTAAASRGDGAQVTPTVSALKGNIFDDRTGSLVVEDVFDPAYVPRNRFGSSLLIVATVDLGPQCVVRTPTPSEAAAIARGQLPSPTRPALCDKPPGSIRVTVGQPGGAQQDQQQALARFSSALDGKRRIPFLFYRSDPCVPIRVVARAGTSGGKVEKTVSFTCGE